MYVTGGLGAERRIEASRLIAIPYYPWNNRGKGEMEAWIPYR
jgi:DUF1680 family protein